MDGYKTRYDQWQRLLPDGGYKDELLSIKNDEKQKEDRFYKELEFGTAGLRGVLGVGTNRMNEYVVRRATMGLAAYINSLGEAEKGVVIAYDSRRLSKEFAFESAKVLAKCGIKVYLFDSLRSVPQLSFSLRHLGCIAGIMITASHNPPEYNGYKVYWKDGGQIGPIQADAITEYIRRFGYFDGTELEYDGSLIQTVGEETDRAYFDAVRTLLLNPELDREQGGRLSVVYTPLHGAGYVPVTMLLGEMGVTDVSVVEEQRLPDSAFPTVKVPNPEDRAAFELAFRLAREKNAELVLATDPDSDRLGAAVRETSGEYRLLTGNQIGCLLLYYILSVKKERGQLTGREVAAKSIVSTGLANAICDDFGVKLAEVPTGFRFIAEHIENHCSDGQTEFLFGFEESYGFLVGSFARDKDAPGAAMMLCEACIYYKQGGKTLCDVLDEIYARYGFYVETVKSYTLEGKKGMEQIASVMQKLRMGGVRRLAGKEIVRFEDFSTRRSHDYAQNTVLPCTMPSMNMVRFTTADGAWICVRPSGTEPKLKVYIGTSAKTEAESANDGKMLLAAVEAEIF